MNSDTPLRIGIQVKPAVRTPAITKQSDNSYLIKVREAAIDGRATDAAIKALAKELGLPKSRLKLLYGKTSRNKVIEIQ